MDRLQQLQNSQVQEVLSWLPSEAKQAIVEGTNWSMDAPFTLDCAKSVPCSNDDYYDVEDSTSSWYRLYYYTEYSVLEGILYCDLIEADTDGNHDPSDSMEVASPDYPKWLYENYERADLFEEEWIDYYRWVIEHGEDPIEEFFSARRRENVVTLIFRADQHGAYLDEYALNYEPSQSQIGKMDLTTPLWQRSANFHPFRAELTSIEPYIREHLMATCNLKNAPNGLAYVDIPLDRDSDPLWNLGLYWFDDRGLQTGDCFVTTHSWQDYVVDRDQLRASAHRSIDSSLAVIEKVKQQLQTERQKLLSCLLYLANRETSLPYWQAEIEEELYA